MIRILKNDIHEKLPRIQIHEDILSNGHNTHTFKYTDGVDLKFPFCHIENFITFAQLLAISYPARCGLHCQLK